MHGEWIMGEHHRLNIVERWPDGPPQRGGSRSDTVHVGSPLLDFRAAMNHPVCAICHNRSRATAVLNPVGARWIATDHKALAD
jgi:hypothetical protein